MTRSDERVIARCVEIADGWEIIKGDICSPNFQDVTIDAPSPELLDALAAQMVRQFHRQRPTSIVPYFDDPLDTMRALLAAGGERR